MLVYQRVAFGNWKVLKVLVPKSSKIRQDLQIQRHYACKFMLPATCPATNILRHTWSGWRGTFTDICHPICGYWHPVEPLITQTHTHTPRSCVVEHELTWHFSKNSLLKVDPFYGKNGWWLQPAPRDIVNVNRLLDLSKGQLKKQ